MSGKRDAVRDVPTIEAADWLSWPGTRRIFELFAAEGEAVRAVGGAVRNTLLGTPVSEVDFATAAEPGRVMEWASRAGLKVVPTGLAHGTVTIVAEDRPFEITTLRTDVETFGRHAKVAFSGDWTEDARRRDFTINALYADADGGVIDPVGGYRDILDRRIRFIGDAGERIREDYLRILRFFRFHALYGHEDPDREGLDACVRERAGLAGLSRERVRSELVRLLVAPGAEATLRAMTDYGLLVEVIGGVPSLPRLGRLVGIEQGLALPANAARRLGALAVGVAEDAERLAERFCLSKAERRILDHAVPETAGQGSGAADDAEALYRLGEDAYRERLLRDWARSGDGPDDEGWHGRVSLPGRWTPPALPVRGSDMVALGVPAGPAVGDILAEIEREWISGGFEASREALIELARGMIAGR